MHGRRYKYRYVVSENVQLTISSWFQACGWVQSEREGGPACEGSSCDANMLKGNLIPYNTFTTADQLFTRHPIWLQAKIESDKMVFEEYVAESRQRELVCIVAKPFQ